MAVTAYIAAEESAGHLRGPLPSSPGIHVSPIGLIPESSQPGAWRMIVDLSNPTNHSVNDSIPVEFCSLHYPSVDDAVQYILALGQNTVLIKIDLKSPYRIIPIHPDDQYLLGISWGEHVWMDLRLPFGLRSAPKIFTAFANAVAWSLHMAGVRCVIPYLDDFLIFCPPRSGDGEATLSTALRVLEDLQIPVAVNKL